MEVSWPSCPGQTHKAAPTEYPGWAAIGLRTRLSNPQRRLVASAPTNSQGMTVFLRTFLMPMPARSASTSVPKNFAPARVSHRREYSCPCKPRDPPAWSWPSRLSRPPAGPERAGHPELVNRRERPSAVVSNVQVLVGCRQQRSGKKRRQPVRG